VNGSADGAIVKWRLTDIVLDNCIDAHVQQEKFCTRIVAIHCSCVKERIFSRANLELNIATSRYTLQNVEIPTCGRGQKFLLLARQVTLYWI
jgi:hypothetical protein